MSLFEKVRAAGLQVKERSEVSIFLSLSEEVGELGKEVAIATGLSNKKPDSDGVVGEAIDIILCAIDLIQKHRPEMSQLDVEAYVDIKIQKWIDKADKS